jgi:PadR family transcriptional regulator PadR
MVEGQTAQVAQMRKGALPYCVLALLRDGERYGFELARELTAAELVAGEGTIYPLLARLRRDGAVETSWRESTQGPPRRYYRLTASGKAALDQFTEEWARFGHLVNSLLDGSR